jgi:hypothetical protein
MASPAAPVDVGGGLYALPEQKIVLPKHWREWLGSIRCDEVEEAPLLLLAKIASRRPGVLDDENDQLSRTIQNWMWGLYATVPLSFERQPFIVTGTNVDGEIDVRTTTSGDRLASMPGGPRERITPDDLRRAALLGRNAAELKDEEATRRINRAAHSFLRGLTERYAGERVHQFVRAIDALTRADNAGQFGLRCSLFVGEGPGEICRQWYVMRSNVEHFRHHDHKLPALPKPKAHIRLARYAIQCEALARYCVSHVIGRKDLWQVFSEDEGLKFWSKPPDEQRALWGDPLNLDAVEFHEKYVDPPN